MSACPCRPLRLLAPALVLTLLTACGGGGGSSSTSPTVPPVVTGPTDPGTSSGTLLATKFFGDFLSAYSTTYPTQIAVPSTTPAVGDRLNPSTCHYTYFYSAPAAVGSGNDPLFSKLWHLVNTGQSVAGGLAARAGEDTKAYQAWTSTKGDGIRVAVIDDAIEITHPDLEPNVLARTSFDYTRPGQSAYPLPCVTEDTHGTSVAGILAARDLNGIGVAGVAPRAQLSAFNALATGLDTDIADALNREQQAISIYHNSWGSADDGLLHAADSQFLAALYRGVRLGRNGKGSIYVFPAGNGGCIYQVGGNNCVEENSNFDGYVNNPAVIVVCAVDDQGEQPYYGERGANVLVCAPSSNYSNQNMVASTAVGTGYTYNFGGTSASTPMVSGVVAMMLQANPALTWRDVRIILARSARKNNASDSRWVTSSGLNFNDKYGFGVVDAVAAVALSKTWSSVGGASTLKTCDIGTQTVNAAVPDLGSKTMSFAVNCPQITKIEFIEVPFATTHPYAGDLRVELVSPLGTTSELATPRVCKSGAVTIDCGDYSNWTFGSVRHLDEAASGTWSLRVTDALAQNSGTWRTWGLRIHGR